MVGSSLSLSLLPLLSRLSSLVPNSSFSFGFWDFGFGFRFCVLWFPILGWGFDTVVP